jgi:hypothetical protein
MSETPIGTRVIAIRDGSSDGSNGTLNIYGYGKYVGNEVPPADAPGLNLGLPNPKIELEGGGVVWGMQCWWGPAEQTEKQYEGWEFVPVPLPSEEP